MMIRIKDGKASYSGMNSSRRRLASPLAGGVKGMVALALAMFLTGSLAAQAAETTDALAAAGASSVVVGAAKTAGSASTMKANVRQIEQGDQKVILTAGRSAVIELTEPLVRAQIANPEVAEVTILSPRQVLITSKGVGHTQLILWDADEQQLTMSVIVELDLAQLQATIAQVAPRANVKVQAIKDAVLLSGDVPDADTADRIMQLAQVFSSKIHNQMKVVGVSQVLLRCTVAEVNKRAVRQLGVNGWVAGDNVRDMFAVNQLNGINPVNIGGAPTANIIQSGGIPFATDVDGLPLTTTPTMSVGFPRVQMQLFFQALRENSLLRVLAEPNLVALSGEEASFLAGGEFAIPIPQGDNGAVTVEFREYGIRLNFTPTVIGQQMVRLRVAPEVSEQDFTNAAQFAGFVIPGLTQRRAETTVELASGTTIALAGLLSEQVRATASRVPALGDVPILGQLFRSVNYQKNMTELVILVTPELVSSMQPDQVAAVPGQFGVDPNDWELFGLGMIEGQPCPDSLDDDAALETNTDPKYRKFRSSPKQMSLHGPWGPAETDG